MLRENTTLASFQSMKPSVCSYLQGGFCAARRNYLFLAATFPVLKSLTLSFLMDSFHHTLHSLQSRNPLDVWTSCVTKAALLHTPDYSNSHIHLLFLFNSLYFSKTLLLKIILFQWGINNIDVSSSHAKQSS